jgi:hypothetical protein
VEADHGDEAMPATSNVLRKPVSSKLEEIVEIDRREKLELAEEDKDSLDELKEVQ